MWTTFTFVILDIWPTSLPALNLFWVLVPDLLLSVVLSSVVNGIALSLTFSGGKLLISIILHCVATLANVGILFLCLHHFFDEKLEYFIPILSV